MFERCWTTSCFVHSCSLLHEGLVGRIEQWGLVRGWTTHSSLSIALFSWLKGLGSTPADWLLQIARGQGFGAGELYFQKLSLWWPLNLGSPGEPMWSAAARRSPMLCRRWFDAGGGRSRFDADGACSKPSKVFFSSEIYCLLTRTKLENGSTISWRIC